jgi:hypothetical protein
MYYLKLSTNRFDSTTYDYAAKRFTEKARVGILETSHELLTLIFTKWYLIVKRIVMFWVKSILNFNCKFNAKSFVNNHFNLTRLFNFSYFL